MACSTPERNKKFGFTALIGYTSINPVSVTPNYIYAHTKGLPGSTADTNYSYKSTSLDTQGNVLKYRFKNMVKLDIEARIHKFGIGGSYRFYSKMQNIDKAFADIESFTKILNYVYPQFDAISVVNYWETHKNFSVFDARISYKLSDKNKLSIVCNNIFNVAYFLRPMKIEPPRSTAVQYVLTF